MPVLQEMSTKGEENGRYDPAYVSDRNEKQLFRCEYYFYSSDFVDATITDVHRMIEIIEHDTPKILAVILDEYFDLLHEASKNVGINQSFCC
jgi:hypothetical protein